MRHRIGIVSEHASPLGVLGGVDSGGQNVYVAQVARRLAGVGYDVDVFTRRDDERLAEIHEWADGVRIIHVPAGPAAFVRKEDLLPCMGEFAEYVVDFCKWRGPYDVLHANFWMSGLVAAEVKKALGTPFVVTFHALGRVRRLHQQESDGFPDDRFAIEDRVCEEADAIVAECPQDERDLIELYGADPSRIHMIPCGFDPEEMWPVGRAAARRELGIPEHEHVVLQLGRLVPRKGIDTVVRGFGRMLREEEPQRPARLLVVGGDADEPDPALTPEIARLQAVAEEEAVGERVHFAGRRGRDRLRYYYGAADVFVTVPWYEPFGITPVESMACGTPVIGADVGGIKYTVVDGETGYLVPPQDPDALAHKLSRMLTQPDLLRTMSLNAVRRANQHFTWDRVAEDCARLYGRVVSANAPTADRSADRLKLLDRAFVSAMRTFERTRRSLLPTVLEAAETVCDCLASGGKVLVCGNGGSAADAQHFAAELVGRFRLPDRPGLPAISLNSDMAVLTAWSNDVGFEQAFARQVEAYGRPGDLLVGISTSGRSRNVVEAFMTARKRGLSSLAILGGDGGALLALADTAVVVPADETPRVQEVHILLLHLVADLVDRQFAATRAPAGRRGRVNAPMVAATEEPVMSGSRSGA